MENFKLFLIIGVLFLSCQAEVKELNLNGKWKVLESNIDNTSLKPHNRLQLIEELRSMVIDIKDDGAIIYSSFYRLGAHGNWNLNPTKDSITFNYKFERAVITDKYHFQMKGKEMHLVTSDFEGTKAVTLILGRD